MLRFVVRQPLSAEYADLRISDLSSSWVQTPPCGYEHLVSNVSHNTTGCVTKGINTVFLEMFGIDYSRLISDKQPIFFLIFIPAGCERYEKDPVERQTLRLRSSEEHDLFAEFLQANGAEVYSMQNVGSYEPNGSGSWDYFGTFSTLTSPLLNLRCVAWSTNCLLLSCLPTIPSLEISLNSSPKFPHDSFPLIRILACISF